MKTAPDEGSRPASPPDARGECELTILMPCLDESETLAACIEKARDFLRRQGIQGEVLVADNGSTDGSQEIARRLGARVLDVPVRGYGAAVDRGARAARGKFIIMGDSDGSYDFGALEAFVEKLREGYDLVMGDRFAGGIRPGAMPWKNRLLGNPALSGVGRLFYGSRVRDFHCGLRGFSREAFDRMKMRTTGMEFASEMVIKATLGKLRIAEVPTTLSPHGRSRPPHLRPWRDGWRHLRFMLLFSPRWLFLYPGLLLMAAGVAALATLTAGPIAIGGVVFDVHTLVFASMAILLGFQAVCFAVFTKVFAIAEGLLPKDPRLDTLFKYVTLETGLIVGALMALGGLGISLAAVGQWASVSFGDLVPGRMLRWVIPGATLLTLGVEVILASFFLSMLGLKLRR